MEPPPGWLWSIATARAFEAFNCIVARELAHHALCAGVIQDVLVELDGNIDLTPEEASAKIGELLDAFGIPRLTKDLVFWIVVSDYVRMADPKKSSYEIAWSLPSMCRDFDHSNPFWKLSSDGEAVWEFRHRRGFSGFPTWWGLSRNEFVDLESDVAHRIQVLREWQSGLGGEADAWIRMWAHRYSPYDPGGASWPLWSDPREEWTLDFA